MRLCIVSQGGGGYVLCNTRQPMRLKNDYHRLDRRHMRSSPVTLYPSAPWSLAQDLQWCCKCNATVWSRHGCDYFHRTLPSIEHENLYLGDPRIARYTPGRGQSGCQGSHCARQEVHNTGEGMCRAAYCRRAYGWLFSSWACSVRRRLLKRATLLLAIHQVTAATA
jgi:hypothetical protein